MRSGLAIVALVAIAIVLAAVVSQVHPGSRPATDIEAENAAAEAKKQAELQKAAPPEAAVDPTPPSPEKQKQFDAVRANALKATLEFENRGVLTLELYPKAAPKTVQHFVALCKRGFYEGIKVHRLEPGFVAQVGDPETKKLDVSQFSAHQVGSHGSSQTVPLEARLPHIVYSVGLARSNAPDSGDSQFYINLKNNEELDGKYCVFGRVIAGTELLPKLQIGDTIRRLSVP